MKVLDVKLSKNVYNVKKFEKILLSREDGLLSRVLESDLTIEECIHMAAGNSFWSLGGVKRLGIEPVRCTDASNGLREQYKDEGYSSRIGNRPSICYPSLCAMGCSFDESELFELGKVLGEECLERGIGLLLGPGINIKRNPLCGRNFEYISEDPLLSGKLGAAFIRGVQSTGVGACPKHFAANNQESRRCKSDSVVSDEALFEVYLRSFEIAVKEGKPWAIMGAYNRLNGSYCCENKWLLEDVLRKGWGFDGTVISDWGAVNDMAASVNAGLDVEMPGGVNQDEEELLKELKKGKLKKEALYRAAGNILKLTRRTERSRKGNFQFDREKHKDVARQLEESSFVLLKNEGMLPLKKNEKILVIGEFAKRPRYQGSGSGKVKMAFAQTPWMCLREAFPEISFEVGYDIEGKEEKREENFEKALKAAAEADKVLFFAGLPESYESEGFDRENMKLPEEQTRLIRALSRSCRNVGVILQAGAPVEMLWKDDVQAILMCYLGGSCLGSALSSVLSGEVNPSGRLAESMPMRLADTPSYEIFPSKEARAFYEEGSKVGYRYYNSAGKKTAFPFGAGLSYTSFFYEGIGAEAAGEKIKVICQLKNTGEFDGKETIQIYIAKKENPEERKLAAFTKVFLEKGEERQAELFIEPEYVSRFDEELSAMTLEKGSYIISAGKNSEEMLAETVFEVGETLLWPLQAECGQSKKEENFYYIEKEAREITPNSSLRDLQHIGFVKPFTKLVYSFGGKVENGIIRPERVPEMLMDSPFRQLPMGCGGKISMKTIRKTCNFFNKLMNKKGKSPKTKDAKRG